MPRNCDSRHDLPLYMTSRFSNFPSFLSDPNSSGGDHSKLYGIVGCIILVAAMLYIFVTLTPVGRGCMGRLSAKIVETTQPSSLEAVEVASDSDLEEHLKKYSKCFVMFYAPWCGHCKTTKPVFSEASRKEPNTKFLFANCQDNISRDVMSKYGVDAFPKMLLYKDGKVQKEFKQQRTVDSMVDFCTK